MPNRAASPAGAFAGYLSEPDASTACQNCLVQSSCDDARGCGTSAECDAFWTACQLACQTFDCKAACASEHEAGAGLFRPLYKDFSGACAAGCGCGDYWACAGHVSWPASELGDRGAHLVGLRLRLAERRGWSGCLDKSARRVRAPRPRRRSSSRGKPDAAGFFTLQYPQMLSPTGIGTPICVQTSAPGRLFAHVHVLRVSDQPAVLLDRRQLDAEDIRWHRPADAVRAAGRQRGQRRGVRRRARDGGRRRV